MEVDDLEQKTVIKIKNQLWNKLLANKNLQLELKRRRIRQGLQPRHQVLLHDHSEDYMPMSVISYEWQITLSKIIQMNNTDFHLYNGDITLTEISKEKQD